MSSPYLEDPFAHRHILQSFFLQIKDQYGYLLFPTMRNSIGNYSFEQREKREEEMLVSAFLF